MASIAFPGFKGTRVLLQTAKAASKSSTSTTARAAKAATKKKTATSTTSKRSKSTVSVAKREVKNPAAASRVSTLLKLHPVSPALRSFLGVSETCRPHAIKEVWAYAKLHNLQNHENKREIFCDEKLKTLFGGKEKVGFSDIGKMISQHILKTA